MSSETWSAERVRARLLAMGDTLVAWRPLGLLGPRGLWSAMPDPLQSRSELFAAQVERVALVQREFAELGMELTQARLIEEAYGAEAPRQPQPSARAIDEMTEAIGWFRHIKHGVVSKTPLMRKVVWEWALRRNRRGGPLEPTQIAKKYELHRETVRLWLDQAVAMIARALNRADQ